MIIWKEKEVKIVKDFFLTLFFGRPFTPPALRSLSPQPKSVNEPRFTRSLTEPALGLRGLPKSTIRRGLIHQLWISSKLWKFLNLLIRKTQLNEILISLTHVLRKAFRRSLENYNCIQLIILLRSEKFAGGAPPDRLLFERYEEKEIKVWRVRCSNSKKFGLTLCYFSAKLLLIIYNKIRSHLWENTNI